MIKSIYVSDIIALKLTYVFSNTSVETRIALIPKDSNQLLKELTTLVEEIIKNIVKETNVRYSYILKKMLYKKIDILHMMSEIMAHSFSC